MRGCLREDTGYPDLAHLKVQHKTMREYAIKLQRKQQEGGVISVDVARVCLEWVLRHILREDKKCGVFLNSVGIH
jgi:hemerythrin